MLGCFLKAMFRSPPLGARLELAHSGGEVVTLLLPIPRPFGWAAAYANASKAGSYGKLEISH